MECCKASQFSNDAGARIWQAADVGYLALQYGAWLTWACLTLQLSSHLVPLLLQESSLHFLSFFVKTFLVYFTCSTDATNACLPHACALIVLLYECRCLLVDHVSRTCHGNFGPRKFRSGGPKLPVKLVRPDQIFLEKLVRLWKLWSGYRTIFSGQSVISNSCC